MEKPTAAMSFDDGEISFTEWFENFHWLYQKWDRIFTNAEEAENLRQVVAEMEGDSYGTHYRNAAKWARTTGRDALDFTVTHLKRIYDALVDDTVREVYPWYAPSNLLRSAIKFAWRHKYAIAAGSTATIAYAAFWFAYRKAHVVRVDSQNDPYQVNLMKDAFSDHMRQFKAPGFQVDRHFLLAAERRHIEYFCINYFISRGFRFRDVGGSRNRWVEYTPYKHLCFKEHTGFDILRRQKRPETVFECCGQSGQDCPSRRLIPCAMLVDVDYYLDNDELTAVVTGPTYIVNHRFEGLMGTFPLKLAEGEQPEAKWYREGDKIVMTTGDGTPYKHRWHSWQTEGIVVGKHGAFTYVRIGSGTSMDVYYAYPASGVYSTSDPANLKWGGPQEIYSRNHNMSIYRHVDDRGATGRPNVQYEIVTPEGRFMVPAKIIDTVVVQVAELPRDNNYYAKVRAMILSRIAAEEADRSLSAMLVDVIMSMADEYALRVVRHTNTGLDPLMATITTEVREKIKRGAISTLRSWYTTSWLERLNTRRPGVRMLTPWVFKDIRMPTYEVIAPRRHGKERHAVIFEDPFPLRRSSAHAPIDERRGDIPSEHADQRRGQRVDQGTTTDSGLPSSDIEPPTEGDGANDSDDEVRRLTRRLCDLRRVPSPVRAQDVAAAGNDGGEGPSSHGLEDGDGDGGESTTSFESADELTPTISRSGGDISETTTTGGELIVYPDNSDRSGPVLQSNVHVECDTQRYVIVHVGQKREVRVRREEGISRCPSREDIQQVYEYVAQRVGGVAEPTYATLRQLLYEALRNTGLFQPRQPASEPRRGISPHRGNGMARGNRGASQVREVAETVPRAPKTATQRGARSRGRTRSRQQRRRH
nr:hypothetical protein 1 [Hubei odonate virus 12]